MKSRAWAAASGIGLLASLVVLTLQWGGWLKFFEFRSIDLMMQLRGPAPADARILICDIDSAGIDRFGQWPWPRTVLARLVDRLAGADARVIAFDVVFAEPARGSPEDDKSLASAIRDAGNVILGYYFRSTPVESPPDNAVLFGGSADNILDSAIEQVIEPPGGFSIPLHESVEPNIDLLAAAADWQGFFSIRPDADGLVRHYGMVARYGHHYFPALAVRAVQRGLDAGPLRLAPYHGRLPQLRIGQRTVPTDEAGELWINFRGPARHFDTVSAADVIEDRIPINELTDRIVFIGASETGIADLRATPLASVMPGVEVHATVADNLLNQRYIHDNATHLGVSIAAVMLLGPLVGFLVAVFNRPLFGFLTAGTLVMGWILVSWIAFTRFHTHLQIVAPFLAASLAYIGASVFETLFVDARARFIRKTFQQFVSSAVVDEMLRHPERIKLGGERRVLTVLFSDIRDFTSISEQIDAEQLTQLLNAFLTPMTRIVIRHGGTLDKYMGDAIMAFFGAPAEQPDHAARACRAALAMREELQRLNAQWLESGVLPPGSAGIAVGIGLNTGEVSVGNMGSDDIFDYTVIGDNVNLASRLEGLNKRYGTSVLVAESTGARAGREFVFRELDRVRVKGKQQPVTIYELLGQAPLDEARTDLLDQFRLGLEAYRARRFDEGRAIFERILEAHTQDVPAAVYADRCRILEASPPPESWDAVENLTTK